jgi:hypothetical protein
MAGYIRYIQDNFLDRDMHPYAKHMEVYNFKADKSISDEDRKKMNRVYNTLAQQKGRQKV